MAVRSARLAADLQQSREQLVLAREEDRRRIRRDLHDGLGPVLGGVAMRLDAAGNALDSRPRDHPPAGRPVAPGHHRRAGRRTPAGARAAPAGPRRPRPARRARPAGRAAELVRPGGHGGRRGRAVAARRGRGRGVPDRVGGAHQHRPARRAPATPPYGCSATRTRSWSRSPTTAPGSVADVVAGVGLRSIRERAEELGGRTEIVCPPAGGTLVRAWLPMSTVAEETPMTDAVRVLIADDHPVFRDGLASLLATQPGTSTSSATAADGAEAVALAAEHSAGRRRDGPPDAGMNGIDATRRIVEDAARRSASSSSRWARRTARSSPRCAPAPAATWSRAPARTRSSGPSRPCTPAAWSSAPRSRCGSPTCSPARRPRDRSAFPQLTERELEILDLIAAGRNNAQIASALFLAPKTVRNNVSNILSKLQATDRAEAIIRARDAGLGRVETVAR